MTPVTGILVTPVDAIQYDGDAREVIAWAVKELNAYDCELNGDRITGYTGRPIKYTGLFDITPGRWLYSDGTVRDEPPATVERWEYAAIGGQYEWGVIYPKPTDAEKESHDDPGSTPMRRPVYSNGFTGLWEAVK